MKPAPFTNRNGAFESLIHVSSGQKEASRLRGFSLGCLGLLDGEVPDFSADLKTVFSDRHHLGKIERVDPIFTLD